MSAEFNKQLLELLESMVDNINAINQSLDRMGAPLPITEHDEDPDA